MSSGATAGWRTALGSVLMMVGFSGFANVVIDDTPVTEDVTVPPGEELEIRGSGLGAATAVKVTLGDGAKVKFYTTATVAASITSVGGVTFEAADGQAGTVSGKVEATFENSSQQMAFNAAGSTGKLFFGTMTLEKGGGGFHVRGGTVETTGEVTATGVSLYMFEGRLVIRKKWTNATQTVCYLHLDQEQTGDACVEVSEGGSINYGNNSPMIIGGDPNWESKLLLSGGTVSRNIDWHTVHLNNKGTGKGVIEVASGTFSVTGMHCGNKTGSARIVLGDGTWKGNVSNGTKVLVDGPDCTCDIRVSGNFTVDTSDGFRPSVMDFTTCGGTFTFDEGATLKVVGKEDGSSELALNNFTGGALGIDLSQGKAKVNLPDLVAGDKVNLVWALPAAGGSILAATGASPDLTVTYLMTAGGAITAPVSASCFKGFGSVESGGEITVASADDVVTYFTKTAVDGLDGRISLLSGTLFLDESAGDKLVNQGGEVRLQNESPFCLFNKSKTPAAGTGWTNAAGVASVWIPGAVGVVETIGSNGGLNGVHTAHKLLVGGSGNHYWDGDSGRFEIGAGGLEFVQPKMWGLASRSYVPRIVLAADQVWTNSAETGTAYMQFGFSFESPRYYTAYVTAAEGVTDWRIAGNLETWLYSPSNDLRGVTVTVADPARLSLISGMDARLNAKALVLDGSDMAFGAAGRQDAYARTLPTVAAIDAFHLAPTVTLKDGGTLTVEAIDVPFAIPRVNAIGANNAVIGGSVVITQSVTAVSVPAAADALAFDSEIGGETTFEVAGAGTLSLRVSAAELGADVAFSDGGTLVLTGDGCYSGDVTGAGGLVIASSGSICLFGSVVDFAGNAITVTSGTLVLADAAAIPAGAKVVTEGEGALALVDPTGFDKETMMDGTKNLVDVPGLIITDVPRENETVEVGDGETLQVYGSGLGASSSVIVSDGGAIRFYRTATVAASVTLRGNAEIATEGESVIGTVAGGVSAPEASPARTLDLSSRGTLRFTGGGEFGAGRDVRMCAGRVEISGKTFTTSGNLLVVGGWLKICDGGYWDCSRKTWTYVNINQVQTGDATVEVAEGGTICVGNSNFIYIGKDPNHLSRLLVNGGTISRPIADYLFQINSDGTGNGVVEFNSGLIDTTRSLICGNTTGNPQFIWRGGTVRVTGKYQEFVCGKNLPVTIAGPDCVFDLSSYNFDVYSNCVGNAGIIWRGEAGARLAVKGSKSRDQVLRLCDFLPDGMAVDLNAAARANVEIEGTGADVALGWTTPGTNGTVTCIGTPSPLLASYFVPAGTTFENVCINDRWHSGFSSVVTSNLLFEADATYLLRTTAEKTLPNLELRGLLTLPETLTYAVDQSLGQVVPSPEPLAIVTPALGIEGCCTWICGGGISKKNSRVFAEGGVLKFEYTPAGMILLVW